MIRQDYFTIICITLYLCKTSVFISNWFSEREAVSKICVSHFSTYCDPKITSNT